MSGQGYDIVDAVLSGKYVYVLTKTTDENWFTTQSRLQLWSSWDGGASFKPPVKVTVPTSGGSDYATTTQDAHYSPNLYANGSTVNITWLNIDNPGGFDGWKAATLRTRRSTTNEIFYRRIAPAPAPGATDKVLFCVNDASGVRSDNMQVAASPDLNFTNTMTMEF